MSLRRRLDALDDRFAARGPLALVREVPQLAMLAVAVVFFAGTGTVLAQSADEDGGTAVRPATEPVGDASLGPVVGERVDAYYADARRSLTGARPGDSGTALITLRTALTPAQAERLTAGLRVERVYLRAAAARRPQTVPVAVTDLPRDLAAAYARLVRAKTAETRALQAFAASIDRASLPQDRAAADDDVRVVAAERAAYAQRCACVMAIVVSSSPPLLAELLTQPQVAAVELTSSPLDEVEVIPLAPQAATTGVVAELPAPPATGSD